jgi:predicted DNA-binding transcriptional regulator AlpA
MAQEKATRLGKSLRKELELYEDHEVAAIMGWSLATLRNRRTCGDAPRSSKVGAKHLTSKIDVREFITRRKAVA